MTPARVSVDRVVVHGGRFDAGDVTRLPEAIRAALRRTAAPNGVVSGVDAIANAVARAVVAETSSRGGRR